MTEEKKKHQKTIAIDFDGVLADYSKGWQGKDVFGDMIKGADSATQVLKENGWKIIVFTTREATDALRKWLADNNISYDYINENPDAPEDAQKGKVIADIYLDDRGICFRGEWKWVLEEIAYFSPWKNEQVNEKEVMQKEYKDAAKSAKKHNPFVVSAESN